MAVVHEQKKITEVTLDTYNLDDSVSVVLADGSAMDIFSDGIVHVKDNSGDLKEFSIREAADKVDLWRGIEG